MGGFRNKTKILNRHFIGISEKNKCLSDGINNKEVIHPKQEIPLPTFLLIFFLIKTYK